MVLEKQQRMRWFVVDDLKISQRVRLLVDNVIDLIEKQHGKMVWSIMETRTSALEWTLSSRMMEKQKRS